MTTKRKIRSFAEEFYTNSPYTAPFAAKRILEMERNPKDFLAISTSWFRQEYELCWLTSLYLYKPEWLEDHKIEWTKKQIADRCAKILREQMK